MLRQAASGRLHRSMCVAVSVVAALACSMPAHASYKVFEKGDSYLRIGGLLQFQYRVANVDGDPAEHDVFIRRVRPTLVGAINKDWQAIFQIDFGAGGSGRDYRVTITWANMQYVGVRDSHLTMGSFKPWFSREFLTLGSQIHLVERTFVGQNAWGTPDYTLGVGWDQVVARRKVFYAAALGAENHDPRAEAMGFRSAADSPADFNRGWVGGARVDLYALGEAAPNRAPLGADKSAYDRTDFGTKPWTLMFSLGGYGWWNGGRNNTYTQDGTTTDPAFADLQRAFGAELSSGLRGFGLSLDLEYQLVRGVTVDPVFTGGLYRDGSTELHKVTLDAGYMVYQNHLEIVAHWSYLNATNYALPANLAEAGLNWFIKEYRVRFSLSYRRQIHVAGTAVDGNVGRVQAQFIF